VNSNVEIQLRSATIEDLIILQYWDQQQHNIDADPNDDWNWEFELTRTVPWREQLIAELNNRPIGFIQIIDPHEEESHYWGEVAKNLRAIDIWIGLKEDLGKGYGTIMMRLALDRCFENTATEAVLIDPLKSNIRAIQFYERLGFRFVEERTFGEDECCVYQFDKKDWKPFNTKAT
jgi:aminoglycoside 6'-N-acetyltransferase